MNWKKASRSVSQNGYIRRYVPWHPLSDRSGYAYEHRLVLYDRGVRFRRGKTGHHCDHINGRRDDNRPRNLRRMTCRRHNRWSQKGGGR